MEITQDDKLYKLAALCPKPVYLVGGAVRNALLGFPLGDFDTASANLPDEVKAAIKDSEFRVTAEYKRTGTLLIEAVGFKTEHTTFRRDSYPLNSGVHTPDKVEFTEDIAVDAARRDFSANAVYYDVKKREIVDPTGGIPDIERGILRAASDPDRVLGEDALRIMRLVRFRAELGFDIEPSTYDAAKRLGYRVKDISVERITDEFVRTVKASAKYGIGKVSIEDSLKVMNDFGCYRIATGLEYMSEAIPYLNGGMSLETILAGIYYREDNAEELLKSLKYSNATAKAAARGIAALNASGITLPEYIAEHYDGYLTVKELVNKSQAVIIDSLAASGVPMRISDLQVNGVDVTELGVTGIEVGKTLKRLLINSIAYLLRTRGEQLEELKKIVRR